MSRPTFASNQKNPVRSMSGPRDQCIRKKKNPATAARKPKKAAVALCAWPSVNAKIPSKETCRLTDRA